MNQPQPVYIGNTPHKQLEHDVQGEFVALLGEQFYRLQNYDAIEPFFMSIVSNSDHWLFISSTGGLSAGRGNAEQALFPYYTEDKLAENADNTGNKAILLVTRSQHVSVWEPFSDRQRGSYHVARSLYKNVTGTALVFEEHNHDLGLTYRYAWRTSEKFGFVKTTWLINTGDSACNVDLVDGLQNLLPANIATMTQNNYSPLLNAYKRSELDEETGFAMFSLSSRLTDLAEPSESLLATTVAQIGLSQPTHLLSSVQIERFRAGQEIVPETDVCGRRCAYLVRSAFDLAPQEERTWHLLADVQQDSAAVAHTRHWLQGDHAALLRELEDDIAAGQAGLWALVASADGVHQSNNPLVDAAHFANVMFNVMRGGIMADQYWIQAAEFADFVATHNRPVRHAQAEFFASLPAKVNVSDLQTRAETTGSVDLIRLSYAYLPLTFSRRHGDPSRPWNRFAINIKKPDGSLKLDYEGNWRDIFQNWEALAYSYPEFIEGMISTFLNATTADGYNPYRITLGEVDWELPEPGNPWANIGYWSDHQIIYLLKLMEISTKVHPGKLQSFLDRPVFSDADVPYRIKPYSDLLKDPYNTIDFDWDAERRVEARLHDRGTDGKLVQTSDGHIRHTSLAEKLLVLLLGKLANFVPEGGIWMNTQRPEWNDANNALVGKGLSVVTLCYLRRYLAFCVNLFNRSELTAFQLSAEVHTFYRQAGDILSRFHSALRDSFSDEHRRSMMDALGEAGSQYRWNIYQAGFSGEYVSTPVAELVAFLQLTQQHIEHSVRANKRTDDLYHAYNILHIDADRRRASISPLYEMLEGQVAVLSSGLLSGAESVALLHSLRRSALYRSDQHTYILYPDRHLPGFLRKNNLTNEQINGIALLAALARVHDTSVVTQDVTGVYHFSGQFRNVRDVNQALDALANQPHYAALVQTDADKVRALFEATFRHDEFTGRSGTFFAYEGLGSVYWHMVAKLLLAVQETAVRLRDDASARALLDSYVDVRHGLSFYKTPEEYGAFPTDPYSHTPKGQGAKQPGMTGAVKEIILTRQTELGLTISDGRLVFDPLLFDPREGLAVPASFSYLDVSGQPQRLDLKAGTVAYSVCQVPIVVDNSHAMSITVHFADGKVQHIAGTTLDSVHSRHIFLRDGVVQYLTVSFAVVNP